MTTQKKNLPQTTQIVEISSITEEAAVEMPPVAQSEITEEAVVEAPSADDESE